MIVYSKPLLIRPHETLYGSTVEFIGADAPLRELSADLPYVQLGSGTPSTTNICPIVSYGGIAINATRKNLFNEATAPIHNRYFYSSSGTYRWRSSSDSRSYIFRCKPNTDYTITGTSSSLAIFRAGYITATDLTTLTTTGPTIYGYTLLTGPGSITVQTGADATYLVIQGTKAVVDARSAGVQIELGTTATAFEAYNGQVVSEDWSGSLGQIAAATYDALAGAITVSRMFWEFDGTENWVSYGNLDAGTRYFRINLSTNIHASTSTNYRSCSHYPSVGITTSTTSVGFGVNVASSVTYLAIRPDLSVIPTKEDWMSFLAAQKTNGTPVQASVLIVANYRTPTQLTPHTVRSFNGVNNIWSDAGEVTVDYLKQSMLYMS